MVSICVHIYQIFQWRGCFWAFSQLQLFFTCSTKMLFISSQLLYGDHRADRQKLTPTDANGIPMEATALSVKCNCIYWRAILRPDNRESFFFFTKNWFESKTLFAQSLFEEKNGIKTKMVSFRSSFSGDMLQPI